MKNRIVAAILAVAAMLTPACEQHSWKDSSEFFKGHEHKADADHGKEHGHESKAENHGEKKDH